MALNFPASPNDGDIYENFYWDAAAGIWRRQLTVTNVGDLSDVTITNPADNDVLAYDNASSDWINQTAAEAGIAAASHTHTTSDITDILTYVSTNAAPKFFTETTEKTSNYTLQLEDINKVVLMNGTSLTVTVPTNSSVEFPIGTVINVYNNNSTNLSITGDSGVTVRNADDVAQYGEISLRKRATDEWVMVGA